MEAAPGGGSREGAAAAAIRRTELAGIQECERLAKEGPEGRRARDRGGLERRRRGHGPLPGGFILV